MSAIILLVGATLVGLAGVALNAAGSTSAGPYSAVGAVFFDMGVATFFKK